MTVEFHTKQERDYAVLDELATVAQKNIGSSDSTLVVLDVDPERYPAQLAHHLVGNPQEPAIIDVIAAIANPKYPQLIEKLIEENKQSREIERVGELLAAGNNVEVVTDHGDFIDIALAVAALYSVLKEIGYSPKPSIIVNRSVSMIGAVLNGEMAPATDVLQLLFQDTYLSYPRTKIMRQSRLKHLFSDDVEKHNKKMMEELARSLTAGGVLLGYAGSGSVDEESNGIVTMETISEGTSRLMLHDKKTFTLPIAIWLRGEESVFKLCDIPKVLHTVEETHAAMESISNVLTDSVEGKTFKYSRIRQVGKTAIAGN